MGIYNNSPSYALKTNTLYVCYISIKRFFLRKEEEEWKSVTEDKSSLPKVIQHLIARIKCSKKNLKRKNNYCETNCKNILIFESSVLCT